jgi:periplasmic protein TonB
LLSKETVSSKSRGDGKDEIFHTRLPEIFVYGKILFACLNEKLYAMEPNKILSANFLDLVFDGRNKEYGAYELRVTYPQRIKRSLIAVFIIAALAITGAALASSFKPDANRKLEYKEVTLTDIDQTKEPEPIPEPPKKPDPPQTRTEVYTPPAIVPDKDVETPPPTQDDLSKAQIDVIKQDGNDADGTIKAPEDLDKGAGIIQEKKPEEPTIWTSVQVPAKCDCDWMKFLTRNLNGEIPIENGAPVGRYNVIIQFVVDEQGSVSDITPLTNFGYGMEQEAIRVLKKAKGWKPGIQNGHEVKSYHKQPITFVVEEQ